MDVVIIGAGFAGSCAARLLREQLNARVVLLEQDDVPGGMLRTLHTRDGLAYEYGPRVVSVFRGTRDVLPYIREFVELDERDIYQGTRLRPEFPVIPFPIDRTSLAALPCGPDIERELAAIADAGRPLAEGNLREYLESAVGPTLTELAFEGFNRKFWGRHLDDMPAEWGKLRRLERIATDGQFRLPSVAPHYYPRGGFNALFEEMVGDLDVRYGVRVERVESNRGGVSVETTAGAFESSLVIATAPIDALFEYRFGPLEWRGYRIEVDSVGADQPGLGVAPDGIPFAWLYTPWEETPVCRTTDFRVIHHGADRREPGVVAREIVDDNVRMYPVWWENTKFERYLEAASQMKGLIPLGRLGLYKYVTMDSTYSMVRRFVDSLETYLTSAAPGRLDFLHDIRGGWEN